MPRSLEIQILKSGCAALFLAAACLYSLADSGGAPRASAPANQLHPLARQQFSAALAAYRTQRYSEAQNILAPLAKSSPDNFEINELLGLALAAEGEDERANPFLAKAVKLRPGVTEARTSLATNLLRLHRNSQAELQFKKVVETLPRSYEANHNMGEFYVQTDRLADAIVFLKRAQEINPSAKDNGYDLALAYDKSGNLEQARNEIHGLIRTRDSADLHSLLGEIEEKSKNYLAAAKEYEKAVQMDPSEQNILDWGTELLFHQTFKPAVEVFSSGLARFPQSNRLQLGLGIALYGDGRNVDSAAAFLKASDMSPPDPLPLTFLGKAYDSFSPAVADQVRTRLKAFIENNPRNAPVRYYYALSLWKLNEKEPHPELAAESESLLKSALAIDPGYTDAYLQLGIIDASQNRYGEAIMNFKKALEFDPNLASVHYRLGQALMRSGDAAHAREEFATFERLREKEAQETEKSQIEQFVYTMRNPSQKPAR